MTLWIDGETGKLHYFSIDGESTIAGYSYKHELIGYQPDIAYQLSLNMCLLAYCKGLNRR